MRILALVLVLVAGLLLNVGVASADIREDEDVAKVTSVPTGGPTGEPTAVVPSPTDTATSGTAQVTPEPTATVAPSITPTTLAPTVTAAPVAPAAPLVSQVETGGNFWGALGWIVALVVLVVGAGLFWFFRKKPPIHTPVKEREEVSIPPAPAHSPEDPLTEAIKSGKQRLRQQ